MSIARYTQRLMDGLDAEGQVRVLVTGTVTESIARSRIQNAAHRLGVKVTTRAWDDTIGGRRYIFGELAEKDVELLALLRVNRTVLQSLRNKLAEKENEQAALVRKAHESGMLQREIAAAAGISQQRTSQVLGKDDTYAKRRHYRKVGQ